MAIFGNGKYSIQVNPNGFTNNGKNAINVSAKLWENNGKKRIYISMSYACGGYKQDCGYICLSSEVPTFVNPYKGNNKWHADYTFQSAVIIKEVAPVLPAIMAVAAKLPVCKSSLMRFAHQLRKGGMAMSEAMKAAWAAYKNA
jgi:hypothetical protein